MKKLLTNCGLFVLLLCATQAQATLIDRGNGLVYDSVGNISWTKDGVISGLNSWDNQNTFAANLMLAGFDDFRLASLDELASLYGQLPGIPGSNKTGAQGPFPNIQPDYWSGTERNAFTAFVFGFDFGDEPFGTKTNGFYAWAVRPGDSQRFGAGALVPEPGTGVLLGIGLLSVRLARRWRGRTEGS